MACPSSAPVPPRAASESFGRPDAERLLRRHPLFSDVPDRDRRALVNLGQLHHASDGELLFQRGDRYRGGYLLLQGIVEIYRTTMDGRRLVLDVARPGGLFALEPLGDPAVTAYTATADVVEAAAVWCLPAEATAALVQERPALGRSVLCCMARSAQELADRLENQALYSVQERLARYVLKEADGGEGFALDIRKATLAAYLGTVPETLSRALHALTSDDLIRQENGRIVLVDEERLHELAER